MTEWLRVGAPALEPAWFEEVRQVLASGWLGTGPRVAAFEQAFADHRSVPVERVVATQSCSAALMLALQVAGIGPGDQVLVPAYTFAAAVNAVHLVGAEPVPVDSVAGGVVMDADHAAALIGPRTRAIMVLHVGGAAAPIAAFAAIAARHGLTLIEDCAHALETRSAGTLVGRQHFSCFSFHATKTLACGNGGMLVTPTAAEAATARRRANHGVAQEAWQRRLTGPPADYCVLSTGFKLRMSDVEAAIGLPQWPGIEARRGARAQIWQRYRAALAHLPITLPVADAGHAHYLFSIQLPPEIDRATVLDQLSAAHIGAGVHYRALTDQPGLQDCFGWRAQTTPIATAAGRATLSLPLNARMGEADVARVAAALTRGIDVAATA